MSEPRITSVTRLRSKELRQNMTGPERKLWSLLRGRRLGGLKFRRQAFLEKAGYRVLRIDNDDILAADVEPVLLGILRAAGRKIDDKGNS